MSLSAFRTALDDLGDRVTVAGTYALGERLASLFDEDGYFGNGGYAAYIYTLAALEVTRS